MSFLINPYIYATGDVNIVEDYNPQDLYSVRLCSSVYAGALVRIRRSSDNAEKDFYPDTNGELSLSSEDGASTSLSTWIGANDGFIVTWYSQVSGGQNVTQSTAANQPRIVNAGALETKNGKAGLRFQGTNDNLLNTLYTGFSEPHSLFAVASNEASATNGGVVSTRDGASQEGSVILCDRRTNKVAAFSDYGASSIVLNYPAQINTNSQRLLTYIVSSFLASEAWLDGSSQDSDTIPDAIASGAKLEIGSQVSTSYLNGYIQEVIIFNTDETSNRADIETDMNNHFSVY